MAILYNMNDLSNRIHKLIIIPNQNNLIIDFFKSIIKNNKM